MALGGGDGGRRERGRARRRLYQILHREVRVKMLTIRAVLVFRCHSRAVFHLRRVD